MKDFAGTPGTLTGLFLRMGQCFFAAGAIASMVTSKGFFNVTAFCKCSPLNYELASLHFASYNILKDTSASCMSCILSTCHYCSYLIASMALQVIWSFGLAFFDAYFLAKKKSFHNHVLLSLFVVGDWCTGLLSLAAAASSAGVTVLYFHDLGSCSFGEECTKFQLSVAFAFLSWISILISSLIMFWIWAAG